jgi:hypothetical protein
MDRYLPQKLYRVMSRAILPCEKAKAKILMMEESQRKRKINFAKCESGYSRRVYLCGEAIMDDNCACVAISPCA